jgi:hypothetical protein
VELQRAYEDLKRRGYGLVIVTYDPVETLKKFADSRGITFPMISDQGSAIIRRYGLLNETVERDTRAWGIPHPGTFILDTRGVVRARYFEDAYQERNTVASILARMGESAGNGQVVRAESRHLTLHATASDTEVAPGKRISLVFDIAPARGMHVYAPGKHDYQVVSVSVAPEPWLRAHALNYPPSEVYDFKELNEKVEVYSKPFRLVQDVTILATPDVQKMLAGMTEVTIAGALEYQACDDKVCYNPARVPFRFTLAMKPLDRRPPGGE